MPGSTQWRKIAILILVLFAYGAVVPDATSQSTSDQARIQSLRVASNNSSFNGTMRVGDRQTLNATATLSDSTTRVIGGGGGLPILHFVFAPQIGVTACTSLAPSFLSQVASIAPDGSFHEVWSVSTPNVLKVDGQLTSTSVSGTLKCAQTGSAQGSFSGTWTGNGYAGNYTFTNSGTFAAKITTWTSSNPGVASVDASGILNANGLGTATITASFGSTCWPIATAGPSPTGGCEGSVAGTMNVTVSANGGTGGTGTTPTDDNNDQGPIKSGYAVITPIAGAPASGLTLFETFGLKQTGGSVSQAVVFPPALTTSAVLFVNANTQLNRNLGLAIVNPNASDAGLTLKLYRNDGVLLSTKPLTLQARKQTAIFITELFPDQAAAFSNFSGSLSVTADKAVAMLGLRFRSTGFSTVAVTSLSAAVPVPAIAPGVGGAGALILPHFAQDGGWSTEINIMNPGSSILTAQVDFFDANGNAAQVKLNGMVQSSFVVTVPSNGVVTLAPVDANGFSRF